MRRRSSSDGIAPNHAADSRARRTELLPGRCPFGARAVSRHLVGHRRLEPRANRAGHDDQRPGGAGVQRTRRPAGRSGGASAPVGRRRGAGRRRGLDGNAAGTRLRDGRGGADRRITRRCVDGTRPDRVDTRRRRQGSLPTPAGSQRGVEPCRQRRCRGAGGGGDLRHRRRIGLLGAGRHGGRQCAGAGRDPRPRDRQPACERTSRRHSLPRGSARCLRTAACSRWASPCCCSTSATQRCCPCSASASRPSAVAMGRAGWRPASSSRSLPWSRSRSSPAGPRIGSTGRGCCSRPAWFCRSAASWRLSHMIRYGLCRSRSWTPAVPAPSGWRCRCSSPTLPGGPGAPSRRWASSPRSRASAPRSPARWAVCSRRGSAGRRPSSA